MHSRSDPFALILVVEVVVVVVAALFYIIINFESITFFVILYPRHQGVGYLVSGQPLQRADFVVCLHCS